MQAFVAALRAYGLKFDGSRSHQISETIVEQRRKQLKTVVNTNTGAVVGGVGRRRVLAHAGLVAPSIVRRAGTATQATAAGSDIPGFGSLQMTETCRSGRTFSIIQSTSTMEANNGHSYIYTI